MDEETVADKLQIVKHMLIEAKPIVTLKNLVAIAYFKRIAKSYFEDIMFQIKGEEG